MKKEITIHFGGQLYQKDKSIYYRICSEQRAWRKVPINGSASHKNLDSALYGDKGALRLFGNNAFSREREKQYGAPLYIAIWPESSYWALLIKNRVGVIIPQSLLASFEEIGRKEATKHETIELVSKKLTHLFNGAKSNILIDDQEKLSTWTGHVSIHEPGVDEQLNEIAKELDVHGEFTIHGLEDERVKTLTEVVRRRGQPAFRNSLIKAYKGHCAISDCDALEALEAAHIYPYAGEKTHHVTNGILLRSDLHTLFDLGLLTVEVGSMTVQISESLIETSYGSLHGVKLRLPDNKEQRPSTEALKWHGEQHIALK